MAILKTAIRCSLEVVSDVKDCVQARSDEMGPDARVGEWKHLRATDKYENEYLLLHHTKTGFQAEMHHYSE